MVKDPLVSVCIPCHNQGVFLARAIKSVKKQFYRNIEIIVLNDASTDKTCEYRKMEGIRYFETKNPSGTGGCFNNAISKARGEIIVLLCADDLFTHRKVIQDIVERFTHIPSLGHLSRYYYQFIDGKKYPVRAWRGDDVIELANNPSGLAFRREAIKGKKLTNKMFVEVSTLVDEVIKEWAYDILRYDTVAVRIHNSISQSKDYYLKMWKSSPVEEWKKVGGHELLRDYTSLIQIKNNFRVSAVYQEICNFIKYRPINILAPGFWFYATISLITPRFILRKLPNLYRKTWGRWTTREIKRP